MPKIRLPDGRLLVVPDDYPKDKLKVQMMQKNPEWFPEQSNTEYVGDLLKSFGAGAATMATEGVAGAANVLEAGATKLGLDDNFRFDGKPGNPVADVPTPAARHRSARDSWPPRCAPSGRCCRAQNPHPTIPAASSSLSPQPNALRPRQKKLASMHTCTPS